MEWNENGKGNGKEKEKERKELLRKQFIPIVKAKWGKMQTLI